MNSAHGHYGRDSLSVLQLIITCKKVCLLYGCQTLKLCLPCCSCVQFSGMNVELTVALLTKIGLLGDSFAFRCCLPYLATGDLQQEGNNIFVQMQLQIGCSFVTESHILSDTSHIIYISYQKHAIIIVLCPPSSSTDSIETFIGQIFT